MKFSTKAEYGARAILDLALHESNQPILVKDIARRQGISQKYLGYLLTLLQRAGLVKSVRGAKGGYLLSKPTNEIRFIEVIKALEGSLAPVKCVDDANTCDRASWCVTRDIWNEMKQAMHKVLKSITLEEMCQRHRQKTNKGYMYYI